MLRMADLYVSDERWMINGGGGEVAPDTLWERKALLMMLGRVGVDEILPAFLAATSSGRMTCS
jgi:hypothetical protein